MSSEAKKYQRIVHDDDHDLVDHPGLVSPPSAEQDSSSSDENVLEVGNASKPSDENGNANHSLHMSLSSSFDLDLDEEEDDLQRYNLDFETSTASFPQNAGPQYHSWWNVIQTIRMEARLRRAQRLLQFADNTAKHRLQIFCGTWCYDASDSGVLLLLVGILAWVVGLVWRFSWSCLGLGILIIGARTACLCSFCQLSTRRRRFSSAEDDDPAIAVI